MANPKSTRLVQTYKHTSPGIACRFDPTGNYLFVSSQDNAIQRWNLGDGKMVLFQGHKSWVRGIAFHPAAKTMYSGDYAGKILAWPIDAAKPQPAKIIDAHQGWVRAVAVSPDGSLLASAGNDHLVKLWSLPEGKLSREFAGHDCHVYNVCFHPDGKTLVSADHKGAVHAWDLASGKIVKSFDASVLAKYDTTFRATIGGIRSMTFNADGSLLACAGITGVTNAFAGIGNPIVLLFDYQSGKKIQSLVPSASFRGTAWGVEFHPEGFIIGVGGGQGGALWYWKANQNKAFHTVKLPNVARDLSLHRDGKRLAIPFYDNCARVYAMS
ncbi:MAG: hypothetical protein KatS3mg105_3851 [Gemmatales bacterium]|nr:MAG: hypothetical protein KatS3mg105_3851 [Gemmatales bacterium]